VGDWLAALQTSDSATTNTDGLSSPKDDDLYSMLDGVLSLADGNSSTIRRAFGYSDYANRIPMTEDSQFPIASNSKLYTAVAIYQLQEEGKLDVKADISTMLDASDFEKFGLKQKRKFCPRLPYHYWGGCEKMTLEHLLGMSSGIYPQMNCDAHASSKTQCDRVAYIISSGSIAQTVGHFINEPLMFKPGSKYHYSNPNFILATYFVEKYSGMTFRDYLQTHILSRVDGGGLNHTYFDYFNEALQFNPRRVSQYFKYYDEASAGELLSVGKDVVQLDLGVAAGTGGIISTMDDERMFWYALFNKTTKGYPLLATEASQRAILSPFSFVGRGSIPLDNNGTLPIWSYYGQGIGVICDEEKCPSGPRWIQYAGGTFTCITANFMDYTIYAMTQVWTSTLVMVMPRDTFEAKQKSQTGLVGEMINEWGIYPTVQLCVNLLFSYYPPAKLETITKNGVEIDISFA